jgi:hypothetical protein
MIHTELIKDILVDCLSSGSPQRLHAVVALLAIDTWELPNI